MISIYTPPPELLREFSEDRQRAIYWMRKVTNQMGTKSTTAQRFREVICSDRKDKRGEIIMYDSPKTGNQWMLWHRFISRGQLNFPDIRDYQICYQLTEPYMTAIIPTRLTKYGVERKGVTIISSHVFMRIAQRLKVDMTDRFLVMRNFAEEVMLGLVDIRDPRKGEDKKQAICRLPRSWLRGYYIPVGDSYVICYKTFYTDNGLTYHQRNYLRTFAKIADSLNKAEIKGYFTQDRDGNRPY